MLSTGALWAHIIPLALGAPFVAYALYKLATV